MDQIFVRDLVVEAVIGWYRWEQKIRRPLRFDVTLDVDAGRAARSGDIEDTVDYEAVAGLIRSITEREPHGLLEALAEEIAAAILVRFPCHRLHLSVAKPGAVAGAREVGLTIERTREQVAP